MMTFAWAIVLLEKSVHLSKWGMHRGGAAQAASKQRQFARWLKNARIVPAEIYKCLVQTEYFCALADWAGQKIYLALDSSSLWDEFVVEQVLHHCIFPVLWIAFL
jgi:hypothetical protein